MQPYDTTQLPRPLKNETGKRYGRLTVIEQATPPLHVKKQDIGYWLCRCDCGNTVVTTGTSLRTGHTSSCGCYNKRRTSEVHTTHGLSRSSEYITWYSIRQRCYNRKNTAYGNYGGRGIVMCERWRESFRAFYQDMGKKPGPEYSIDRRDNDGPYSPDNCYWATRQQQAENKRSTQLLTYNGKTQTMKQWARELGIHPNTVSYRYHQGLPPEDILFVGHLAPRR